MPKSEFDEYFALRKKGAFREAYDVLLGILSTSPRWSRVGDLYVWCAELEMTLNNDLKRAQQLLEKARRLGCRYMDAYYRRHGILLCRLGRRRKGIEELERAVELSPSICSLMALAMELTEEEDGRALAVCHRVLDQDPESCWALTYMARLAARAGDRGKALLMIRRAERLSPSEYDIYDIAALWYELGEFQQAIHAYLEADRRGKQPKGPLYAAVAACYFEMGDKAVGRKYLQWATRHDPEHEFVKELYENYKGLFDDEPS